MTLVISVQKLS